MFMVLAHGEAYTIRKLTPNEWERLQGFPDDWTNVNSSSDTKRYEALGNSIALPSWEYVLQRLTLCCGRNNSMASLFDGIGGFPLIWSRLNGNEACVWSSEIDKFAMAVTN